VKNNDRVKTAKEAARLLYYDFVEDYKSAKEIACINLGINVFPTNFEVALELDKLSSAIEGELKDKLLIDMRRAALQIMDELAPCNTKLVGSVWRGTSRTGSDIDIVIYSDSQNAVIDLLKKKYPNLRIEYKSKTAQGTTKRYFHVYFRHSLDYEVELVVKGIEEMYKRSVCDIFADDIVGLTRNQLRKLITSVPLKKHLPEYKKLRK